MITFYQTARFLKINFTFLRYGLGELLFKLSPSKRIRLPLYLLVWSWGRQKLGLAERIRLSLETLGPIFVKFGQALSTRRDLLPTDVADELAKLQDRVPSFPTEQARDIIENALGEDIGTIFSSFDDKPLASASVAQVHSARLREDGSEVVVKVLRPNVQSEIRRDVELMRLLARLVSYLRPESRRLRLVEVVDEYEKTINNELDLVREAANAGQLRRNFEGSSLLYVPKVYWPYCRKEVMVMERIRGIPVSDVERLKEAGVDLKKLSANGVEIFFTQVFEHNFFHADMHPGNIFVSAETPEDPKYIGVDFGIVGTLSAEDQRYLAENFLAFFRHDYKRVAELHVESGWVPEDTPADELESAIRTVCEPIFQRPLSEISFGHLLLRLFQTARRFNMEVQPQLILLQKTLFNIEGLGRRLDPDLDLWETAKPFLEQWVKRRRGPRMILSELRRQAPQIMMRWSRLPEMLDQKLSQLQKTQEQTHRMNLELQRRVTRIKYVVGIIILAMAAIAAVAVL